MKLEVCTVPAFELLPVNLSFDLVSFTALSIDLLTQMAVGLGILYMYMCLSFVRYVHVGLQNFAILATNTCGILNNPQISAYGCFLPGISLLRTYYAKRFSCQGFCERLDMTCYVIRTQGCMHVQCMSLEHRGVCMYSVCH